MKIALINGSPRGNKSTSLCLLKGLRDYLEKDNEDKNIEIEEFTWNRNDSGAKDFTAVLNCNAIVFGFPLYIDSIPSHLLRNLVDFEKYIKKARENKEIDLSKEIKVYTIINNGFFDGQQNCLAVENIKHWTKKVGFIMGEGIGIGGGGMILSVKNVPFGAGPKTSIGKALENMSDNIKNKQGEDFKSMEPNFPSFAYKLMAQTGWRQAVRKNGLKPKDLGRRIEQL